MSFLQSVLEDLEAGRYERAMPHRPVNEYPALGTDMLFSENYDQDYSFGRRNWYITIHYGALLPIRETKLFNGNYPVKLTKQERKVLWEAYNKALDVEQERYLERLDAAQR